jgi:hypothetical protein
MVEALASAVGEELPIVEVWVERAGGMPAGDLGMMVDVQSFRLRRLCGAFRGCWRTPGYWRSRLRREEEAGVMRGDGQRADGGVGFEKVLLWRVSSRGEVWA